MLLLYVVIVVVVVVVVVVAVAVAVVPATAVVFREHEKLADSFFSHRWWEPRDGTDYKIIINFFNLL